MYIKIKLGMGGTTPVYYSKGAHEGGKLMINKTETNLLSGGKSWWQSSAPSPFFKANTLLQVKWSLDLPYRSYFDKRLLAPVNT